MNSYNQRGEERGAYSIEEGLPERSINDLPLGLEGLHLYLNTGH